MSVDELIDYLVDQGQAWVVAERARQRPDARSLTVEERQALAGFFSRRVLERVRVKRLPFIEDPGFYAKLDATQRPLVLRFRDMAALTLVDTILVAESRLPMTVRWLPVLFHEMVHVVQYDILGVHGFIDRYVRGWARNGFNYFNIPLEREAYALSARFESAPGDRFSVRRAVTHALGTVAPQAVRPRD